MAYNIMTFGVRATLITFAAQRFNAGASGTMPRLSRWPIQHRDQQPRGLLTIGSGGV